MLVMFSAYDLRKQETVAWSHTGGISLLIGGKIDLLKENGIPFHRLHNATIFDDSVVPPRLIRMDYDLKHLEELGAKLPETYINFRGDIVNAKGEVIMEGPKI